MPTVKYTKYDYARSAFNLLALLTFLLIIAGISIYIVQVYFWLKEQMWFGLSITDSLCYIGSSWACYPENWFGVYTLLSHIALSGVLLLLGVSIGWISTYLPDNNDLI